MILTNQSGTFYIDKTGTLTHFIPTEEDGPKLNQWVWDLTIPEGVLGIQEKLFQGYTIKTLSFPQSLVMIGDRAFSHCEIENLVIPDGCKICNLARDAFFGSRVEPLACPKGVDPEGLRQLAHCLRFTFHYGLSSILSGWPEDCQAVYSGACYGMEYWDSIINDCGIFYVDEDGVLRDFNLDDNPGPTNTLLKLQIPEGVKIIPGDLFHDLTIAWELSLPNSLMAIGMAGSWGNNFAVCILPDVVLPENLEFLGNFAFGSSAIKSLTIPEPVIQNLLPVNLRQFTSANIDQIRVPVKYKPILEDYCRNRHMEDYSIEEISDPKLGALAALRSDCGIDSNSLFFYLIHK